jgi:hypothetical protein
MSGERRDINGERQMAKPTKHPITAVRLACLMLLVGLGFILAPRTSRSQSQSPSMQIIAGISVPQEGVTCGQLCVGTSTLGYIDVGCRGIPYTLPTSPIPICNTGYGGDGGPAVLGMLNLPIGVAADAAGNAYVADAGNRVVRKIDTSGNISTYACVDAVSGAVSYSGCQPPPSTYFLTEQGYPPTGAYPTGVAVDSQGVVEVAVAFGGTGQGGDLAMTSDPSGNVYRLNMGSGEGFDFTIYENGNVLFSTQGGTLPPDSYFTGLAADSAGNLYTIESGGRIAQIDPSGNFSVVVSAPQLALPSPTNGFPGNPLAIDSNGNLYVITNFGVYGGATVSEYNITTGQWTTVAGTGTNGFNDGNDPNNVNGLPDEYTQLGTSNPASSFIDTPMPATATDLNNANGIALGPDGALYIADTGSNVVRQIGGRTRNGCTECGPQTLALTDTITRPLPAQWGINPGLHKIYMITSANPGVVSVFSTVDDSVITNIPIPGPGVTQAAGATTNLGTLAVDSVNNLVWVADTGTNAVWVINSTTDTLNATSVALPAAPVDIAVDTGLDKAYVTNTEGGYTFAGFPPAVTVVSGPNGANPPAVVAGIGAYGSAGGSLPGATAVAADPQRHFVYVRYFGPSNLGFINYSLAVIDSTKDQIVNTSTLGQSEYQSAVYPDSIAINESNGDVLIGDDYDQYVHLYAASTLSGFFGGFAGYPYHVAADSVNGIFYVWDGYGNTSYLVPNQTSGSITTHTLASTNAGTVAVDQSTDEAYVLTCNSTNGDGTFGTVTLFDGSAKSILSTLPLEIPSGLNNESEYCGGLLVDASNSNPAKHSAWAGIAYQSQNPSSGAVTTTGQIDVINGPTPAARPSISVMFGNVLGLDTNPAPFQDVGVGQTATLEVQIRNNGPGPLNSVAFDIQDVEDPGSLQIVSNGCTSITSTQPLASGGECGFDLAFTPSKVESFAGAVLVLDNAGDTPESIGVSGSGVPDTGGLTIAPNSLPLGVVGQGYGQVFSASGLVGTPTWSISGTLPPDLTFSPALHWIVSSPNILAAADVGTWNFTISVTDSANGNSGSQLYSLTITSAAAGQANATVTIPGGSSKANTLGFGSVEVNQPSATQQVGIETNYNSAANLQIGSVKVTGPNAGDFTESDNCVGQTLTTDQSCALNITFLPTVTPTANEVAEIVIGSNAPIAPIYVTGTSAPALGAPSPLPTLVSADNGNPPNPATLLNVIGCYPPECGAGSSSLGGVSSGAKFVAFSFLAGNLPGPAPANFAGSAASGAYLRNTCLGAAPGTCEESTQYIAYGPTLGTAPGSNGGKTCESTTAGGINGSFAKGIDLAGQFVLFESDTCGFGGSDSTNANQIYLRNALSGNTTLVSVDSSGTTVLDHGASGSSMSSDARFFVFRSAATNAVSGFSNPNANGEVYWRDSCLAEGNPVSGCTPQTTLISQDNASDGFKDNSLDSSISASGRYVVFGSYATMLSSTPKNNDTTGLEQVYLFDTCAGASSAQNCVPSTKLISVDSNGNAVGGSTPSVSSDGRFVTFLSSAATLRPSSYQTQDVGTAQVYLVDTCTSNGASVGGCTGQPPIIVSQYLAVPGNLNSSGATISADGQLVTFTSAASTLPSGGIIAVYEYTNCLSPAAASTCVAGLQVISVNANGNPLQNIGGGDLIDPTGQYFIFGGQSAQGGGYGQSPEVYLAPTTLLPALPAIATFSPFNTGINFVTVNVGQKSPTANLELTNTGTGPLHVYLLSVQNSQTLQSAPFNLNSILCNTSPGAPINVPETVQSAVNLTLEPGAACVFNVTMNPTAPGTFNGSINFATNASQSNAATQSLGGTNYQQSIPMTGTAPEDADLSISAQATEGLSTTGVNVGFVSQIVDNGPSSDTNTTVTYTFSSAVQFESFSVQGSGSTPNSCTSPPVGTTITTFSCDLGSIVVNGGFNGSFSATISVAPITSGQLTMTANVTGDLFDPNTANNTATSSAVAISLGPVKVVDQETIHVNDQEGPNQSIPGLVAFVGDPETINVNDQEAPNQSIPGLVAFVGDPETINVKDMEPSMTCSADVSSQISITRGGPMPVRKVIAGKLLQIGFSQQLTLTNTSATAITGPFEVVFTPPAGVSVVDSNGNVAQTLSCNSPVGAPYLTVPTVTLAPNATATLYVVFQTSSKIAPQYPQPRVLAGTNP